MGASVYYMTIIDSTTGFSIIDMVIKSIFFQLAYAPARFIFLKSWEAWDWILKCLLLMFVSASFTGILTRALLDIYPIIPWDFQDFHRWDIGTLGKEVGYFVLNSIGLLSISIVLNFVLGYVV